MYKSSSFVFDGVPSELYGLMIYFMDDADNRELALGTDVDVIEDRLPKRTSPIHYGVDINKSMSFPLTFGSTDYIEDYDVDAILSWLTGHQQYKWLEFVDGDHYVRYKCHLNNMQSIYINGLPTAFTCDVECDGQFAYEYPITNQYEIDTTEAYIEYLNKSAYNGYLYPKLKVEFEDNCNTLSIINESDNNREFRINYFDREISDTSKREYKYETTLSSEETDVIYKLDKDGQKIPVLDEDGNQLYEEDGVTPIYETEEESGFVSWSIKNINDTGKYNEIIKGTIGESDIWVALPQNGDKALYSEDNGETWNEASPTLPHVGNWTGCFGKSGFVVICTDENQSVASYSQTGRGWTETVIELPVDQKWEKVIYVETKGFLPNQYLAIGSNSSIAAISATGWGWQISSLPISQDWKSAFSGANMAILVGGNQNIALLSTDCIYWEEIELPRAAAWSAGCYGDEGFIMVADTLYGGGSSETIALKSQNGRDWEVFEFRIGSWNDICFSNGVYIATGEKQFAYSFDGITWKYNVFPAIVNNIISADTFFICPIGDNRYLCSNNTSAIESRFILHALEDIVNPIHDIYISATIADTELDTSYSSNGVVLLATNVGTSIDSEAEITGGEYVAVTRDLRYEIDIDGVMMSATYDDNTKQIVIGYVVDRNHTSVMGAPLTISVEYHETTFTDLEYDGLEVDFDNQNQIITTNKESLNMYQYFNRRFLRFVKGVNKLRIKTDAGNCRITITSEFLRKVGGR